MTDDAAYARFLASGAIPGVPSPSAEDRLAFVRQSWKDEAFRRRAWPHFACFVDASNVARWDPPAVTAVNEPKARLWRLVACDEELRRLGYIPVMVSDGNLFHLMDEPYEYRRRYMGPPHSVAKGTQADRIVLQALRKLPEAACISRDRFDKPEDLHDFPEVLQDRSKLYAYRFDDEGRIHLFRGKRPMPYAARRLAERWGAPEA